MIGLIAFMLMRRSGQISTKEGADLVKRGAMIVDVRTPDEYNSGHLSQAFNMPVDEIQALMLSKVRDKNRVILLHCKTGLRSKKAKDMLVGQGYVNVFDMGSYERAFKIVSGRNL
jgi:rhodanese-related sulfurtransferase